MWTGLLLALAGGRASAEERIIKTIQPKPYIKMQRVELSPHLGAAVNDPFVMRYFVGCGLGYHVSEIFAVETAFDFAPDLGRADWKPVTTQLVDSNHVSPGISRWMWSVDAVVLFSPIYGKAAVKGVELLNFEVFGRFGASLVHTEDDTESLGIDDLYTRQTLSQDHIASVYGGGLRLFLTERTSARLEGRGVSYIETVSAGTLQMKNNVVLMASASFLVR